MLSKSRLEVRRSINLVTNDVSLSVQLRLEASAIIRAEDATPDLLDCVESRLKITAMEHVYGDVQEAVRALQRAVMPQLSMGAQHGQISNQFDEIVLMMNG